MEKLIQVSVLCTVYNHGKYLRQCLDGFIMQQGVFYEVLIHDDASTDHSAEIIREYEQKYPDIIKPIYQTDNQYSQHIPIIETHLLPKAQGKYIALCEGDDYWIDPYKLKKQVAVMEANPDCNLCLHRVKVVKEDCSDYGYDYPRCVMRSQRMTPQEYFEIRENAGYYQTSSYFMIAKKYKEFEFDPPLFKSLCPVGDEAILLYFAQLGCVYYIDEIMSHYRYQCPGSWSYKMRESDLNEQGKSRMLHYRKYLDFLEAFNLYTNNRYKEYLENEMKNLFITYISYLHLNKKDKEIVQKKNRKYLERYIDSKKELMNYYLYAYFPKMMKLYHLIKILFSNKGLDNKEC